MIIVDTQSDSAHVARPAGAETLYLTAVSLAEMLVGIAILPEGKRKRGFDTALSELISRWFGSTQAHLWLPAYPSSIRGKPERKKNPGTLRYRDLSTPPALE